MAVRVDPDGQVNVFAGAEQRPIAAAPVVTAMPQAAGIVTGAVADAPRPDADAAGEGFAALLSWFESLDALGFDGGELAEVGLKNGSLVVDDSRSGKRWSFDNINFSLTRPREGGVAFAITSTGADGPWSLTATMTPRGQGRRAIEAVIRDVSPKDVLLALRVEDDTFEADMPISAIVQAEIAADGTVQMVRGRIISYAVFCLKKKTTATRTLGYQPPEDLNSDATDQALHTPVALHTSANA